MDYTTKIDLKSITVTLSDIIKVANIFKNVGIKESKSAVLKIEPRFRITCLDGSGYSTSDPSELEDALIDSLPNIQRVSFTVNGQATSLDFYFSILGDITLNIQSTNKATLFTLKDDLAKLLKKKNLNYIFHSLMGMIFFIIFFQILNNIITLVIFHDFFSYNLNILGLEIKRTILVNNISPLIIGIPLMFRLPHLYPKMVVADKAVRFGRELNNDARWLLGFIFLSFLLPVIIDLVTK